MKSYNNVSFPHSKYNKQPEIRWTVQTRSSDKYSKEGLYIGENIFRGWKKANFIKMRIRFQTWFTIIGLVLVLNLRFFRLWRQDVGRKRTAMLDPWRSRERTHLIYPEDQAVIISRHDQETLLVPMWLNVLEGIENEDDEKQMVVADARISPIETFWKWDFLVLVSRLFFQNGLSHAYGLSSVV